MMRLKDVIIALVALVLAASCISEPLAEGGDTPDGGATTAVTLSVRGDRFAGEQPADDPLNPIRYTRAAADESTIGCLQLLVFAPDGEAVLNEQFANLTLTDGAYRLKTETLPGNGMQFYVIANADVSDLFAEDLPKQLKAITTLDGLKALLATLQAETNGLQRNGRLLMVGNATVNVSKPHREAILLTLNYLSAKVTVTLTDRTDENLGIDITGWDMVNVPRKTHLLEQAGKDAVTGTTPGDYLTTASNFPFEPVDADAKSWTQTCYLFENRRGGREDRPVPTNPADRYPNMKVDDDNQRGKAWYAPAGATYLLVYGTHTQNGQTNNILYKIYLGANAVNDYNLARGKHYLYNVSINGLNDINVDTNVEWGEASFSVATSTNLTMDAHPDFRVLRIGGTAVSELLPAYATVEVLDENGTSPSDWLAVSPLNLYRHSIAQSGNTHQQFDGADGSVGSFVRPRYTPTATDESEFADATFGMTRKLTRIPFAQVAVYSFQNVMVYADGYNGTSERAGKVRVTYYKGSDGTEVVGRQTLDISQSGALRVSDDLYVERYEESAMLMHPGLAAGLQSTTTMQWGYSGATLYAAADRFTNGGYLTAHAVYNTVEARNAMEAPVWSATTYAHYREKYPRTGAKVTEPSRLAVADEVYYYPALETSTAPSDYFHPVFNSSAARYCHEKNRDADGDGVISKEETEWYLPSLADLVTLAQHMPAGLSLSGTYWTATEESNTNAWAYTFPAKTSASAAKTTAYRVRCVRGTGVAALPDATLQSTETDKAKITLACTAGSNGSFSIADATGLTWTVNSSDATWLKIATAATGTGAAASATGTGGKTLYAYATSANTSTTAVRTATITLTRPGMVAKTIAVTQTKVVPPSTVTPTSITLNFCSGQNAAFNIDNKGTGLTWTVTSNQTWLTIATDGAGTGSASSKTGSANATLYAYATMNSDTKNRTATITFAREGMSNLTISITQKYYTSYYTPTETYDWAGCNIYWDGTKLTFDDCGVTEHGRYTGVVFLWGSLCALDIGKKYSSGTSVIFSPNGKKDYAYLDIPHLLKSPYRGYAEDILYTYHNPSQNVGDICRYLTQIGNAPGASVGKKWRLPKASEINQLLSYKDFGLVDPYPTSAARNGTTLWPLWMSVNTGVKANVPTVLPFVQGSIDDQDNDLSLFNLNAPVGYPVNSRSRDQYVGVFRTECMPHWNQITKLFFLNDALKTTDAKPKSKAFPVRCVVDKDPN